MLKTCKFPLSLSQKTGTRCFGCPFAYCFVSKKFTLYFAFFSLGGFHALWVILVDAIFLCIRNHHHGAWPHVVRVTDFAFVFLVDIHPEMAVAIVTASHSGEEIAAGDGVGYLLHGCRFCRLQRCGCCRFQRIFW